MPVSLGPTGIAVVSVALLCCQSCTGSKSPSPAEAGNEYDSLSGAPMINVGTWHTGDDAFLAGISGVLRVDPDTNCVYLSYRGNVKDIVWPAGYAVAPGAGGAVDIINEREQTVASIGGQLEVGGAEEGVATSCAANVEKAPFVMMMDLPPVEIIFSDDDPSMPAGPEFVYTILRDRESFLGSGTPPPTVAGALPGSEFSRSVDPVLRSQAVVIGSVRSVELAQAYALEDGVDAPVTAGSASTAIVSLTVTLGVDEQVCATVPVDDSVQFEFFVTSLDQLERVQESFDAMGRVAVFLTHNVHPDSAIYHQTQLPLLTAVSPGGTLSWPVAADSWGETWSSGGRTVAQLRNACPA